MNFIRSVPPGTERFTGDVTKQLDIQVVRAAPGSIPSGQIPLYPGCIIRGGDVLINGAISTGQLRAFPWLLDGGQILIESMWEVTGASGAGGLGHYGLYSNVSDTILRPDRLLLGSVDFPMDVVATVGEIHQFIVPITGIYWIVYEASGAPGPSVPNVVDEDIYPIYGSTLGTTTLFNSLRQPRAFAALPDPFPTTVDVVASDPNYAAPFFVMGHQ